MVYGKEYDPISEKGIGMIRNNNTRDIILKIKGLLSEGKMSPEAFPANDLVDAVRFELSTYSSCFTDEQRTELLNGFENFCSNMMPPFRDVVSCEIFLDVMLITLSAISDAVLSLANKEYWLFKHPQAKSDPEIMEIIDFIDEKGDIRLLNYSFVDDYYNMPFEIENDVSCGLKYVIYKGKRMYFPRGWTDLRIRDYYCSVVGEQDPYSPHCYDKEGFFVKDGSVLVDVGAAEGIFALDNIEKAKRIYLIDADRAWMEALEHTFSDYREKVEIIYGFVGDRSEGKDNIVLDDLLAGETINYIKMDIEGYEKAALNGSRRLVAYNQNLTCAICSYHCKEDEAWIKDFFADNGCVTDHSRGFICPDWSISSRLDAELRRGIVFAKKVRP